MIDFVERLVRALLRVPAESWIALSFIPLAALFVCALWRADRGEASTFKLVHFVTSETGRGSAYALGYTTLVVVCSWGVWALIVLGKLTEWYITVVCSVFVLGALGGTAARVTSKIKGVPDPNPAAGDIPDEPQPALERKTTVHEETTERTPAAPVNPLAKKKGGMG